MNATVHILTGSGRLLKYKRNIEDASQKIIARASGVIPIKNVDIVIYDNHWNTIPETGEGGKTVGGNTIFISLNPDFPKFSRTLAYFLPRSIFHELHHAARYQAIENNKTLLDAFVSEGLACLFAQEQTDQKPDFWTAAVHGKKLRELINRAEKEYKDSIKKYRAWFFGSELTIPRWAGYSIGYKLVEDYIGKHKGQTGASLYNKPAKEFI